MYATPSARLFLLPSTIREETASKGGKFLGSATAIRFKEKKRPCPMKVPLSTARLWLNLGGISLCAEKELEKNEVPPLDVFHCSGLS